MIDNYKLKAYQERVEDIHEKFMVYTAVIDEFKFKAYEAINENNLNAAEMYMGIMDVCIEKREKLLSDLTKLRKEISNL